jgi:hypothetical protein
MSKALMKKLGYEYVGKNYRLGSETYVQQNDPNKAKTKRDAKRALANIEKSNPKTRNIHDPATVGITLGTKSLKEILFGSSVNEAVSGGVLGVNLPLDETEKYYNSKIKASGKLNSELTKYDVARAKRVGINAMIYVPDLYSLDAAAETNEPSNIGGLKIARNTRTYSFEDFIVVDFGNKQIFLNFGTSSPTMDPRTAIGLRSLVETVPETSEFDVQLREYDHDANKDFFTNLGPLSKLLSNAKQVVTATRKFKKRSNEVSYEDFKYEVLHDLEDVTWYHATRRSNLGAIKRTGLIPSKEFSQQQQQQHGWTFSNLDLQNAVYLTASLKYAREIAETLAEKYNEPAVILKVNGGVLKDKSKVIVDEDSLRDEYDDSVVEDNVLAGMPHFMTSILHKIKSIGFNGTIPPSEVSFVEKINTKESKDEA